MFGVWAETAVPYRSQPRVTLVAGSFPSLVTLVAGCLRAPLSFVLFSPEKTAATSARQVFGHISSVWCSNARLSPQFFGVAGVSQRGARPKAVWLAGRPYSLQRRCRAKPPPPTQGLRAPKAYGLPDITFIISGPLPRFFCCLACGLAAFFLALRAPSPAWRSVVVSFRSAGGRGFLCLLGVPPRRFFCRFLSISALFLSTFGVFLSAYSRFFPCFSRFFFVPLWYK